jgi:hypothetical protein
MRGFLTTPAAISFSVNRDSAAGIAIGDGLDDRDLIPGGDFIYFSAFRPPLGPTQLPIQWVPGSISPGVKRPWLEADHSPSSADVKNGASVPPLPHTSSRHGV